MFSCFWSYFSILYLNILQQLKSIPKKLFPSSPNTQTVSSAILEKEKNFENTGTAKVSSKKKTDENIVLGSFYMLNNEITVLLKNLLK